jgi:hypothetical protein
MYLRITACREIIRTIEYNLRLSILIEEVCEKIAILKAFI